MNSNQLISNEEALRLFFNDDVYLAQEPAPLKSVEKVADGADSLAKPGLEIHTTEVVTKNPSSAAISVLAEPKITYKTPRVFKHLGKNEKGILILVNDAENPVSTPKGVELLRKLLLSIQLKNADFALVNYANYTAANLEELKAFFSCKQLLSFGVSPIALGLSDQNLHQLNTVDEIKMIFTHNLDDLETDVPSKRLLWATLKTL